MDKGLLRASRRHNRESRLLRGVPAGFVAGLLLVMSIPVGPAVAHTYLVSSDPADGGTVRVVPEQVALEFTEQVELDFADVTVSVAGGPAYGALTETAGKSLIARIPPGAADSQPDSGPATWEIAYRVTAGDGHPVNESYSFTISPGSSASTGPEPVTGPVDGGDSGAWASETRPRQVPGWAMLGLGSVTVAAVLTSLLAVRRQSRRAQG
ncbi:copper resistance CopC family protein [Arthrobacter sp. TB 23]|uniref:copper resistance CopC family protein n=1 Tax=Arthrobacter sp. TB 23 TaxID=494419 RepID=UPI0012EAFCF9|nr:copper resistance CopC family protein [Arthrobacter sp. TB 23]